MGVSDVLQIIIRVLTIVLLCVFIFTAYHGAMIMKELHETVNTRLANGEFPLPTGGLSFGGDQQGAVDLSKIKDADVARQAGKVQEGCSDSPAECEKQISLLCNVLKQKAMTSSAAACDQALEAAKRQDQSGMEQSLLFMLKGLS